MSILPMKKAKKNTQKNTLKNTPLNTPNTKKKSAFSLIELAVVLTIVSIIISGAITVSTTALINARSNSTKDKLVKIQEALITFVTINKRLPCPASLYAIPTDVGYGTEAGASGTCTALGVLTSSDPSADKGLVYGAVPVKALGLGIEYLGDGFDNKFSYVVPHQLTEIYNTASPSTQPGFQSTNMVNDSTVNPIIIQEKVSTGSDITNQAAYALIGHGANGSGAFNINSDSTAQNALSGVADEDDNSSTATFNDTFVMSSADSNFDDIVLYGIREHMIQQIGKSGYVFSNTMPCTRVTSQHINENTNCPAPLIFPTVYYGEQSYDEESAMLGGGECEDTGCFTSDGSTPSRRCGLNGQWEPVSIECEY
jgi:prepilin-type N-terminal cleavage/methylation domain-containing protein